MDKGKVIFTIVLDDKPRVRKPSAPPTKKFKNKKAYCRKQKHNSKDIESTFIRRLYIL